MDTRVGYVGAQARWHLTTRRSRHCPLANIQQSSSHPGPPLGPREPRRAASSHLNLQHSIDLHGRAFGHTRHQEYPLRPLRILHGASLAFLITAHTVLLQGKYRVQSMDFARSNKPTDLTSCYRLCQQALHAPHSSLPPPPALPPAPPNRSTVSHRQLKLGKEGLNWFPRLCNNCNTNWRIPVPANHTPAATVPSTLMFRLPIHHKLLAIPILLLCYLRADANKFMPRHRSPAA
ncbi:hypothetical protein BDW22DRAFT_10976 [Trametopsis cervina]|nr:hypothetical protein BDW22DRAFT_10976 [Trametopsis cervina]